MTEQSRVRYFISTNTGYVRDSGFDLVNIDGQEFIQPADTVLPADGIVLGKKLTAVALIAESAAGLFNGNVLLPTA